MSRLADNNISKESMVYIRIQYNLDTAMGERLLEG